jgi:hypothetical protein
MSLAVCKKPCASAVLGPVALLSIVGTALWSLERREWAADRSAQTSIAFSLPAIALGYVALMLARPERANLPSPRMMRTIGFGSTMLDDVERGSVPGLNRVAFRSCT